MENDIFDQIMSFPILNLLKPFYKKHKEILLYLFFGGLAFFLNIGLFFLFGVYLGLNELLSNAIAWILCVIFQFLTNRIWVFTSKFEGKFKFIKQGVSFALGRCITLVIEEIILLIFITNLQFNKLFVKLVAQVIVIVLNYIISKLWVFK